MTEDNSQSGKLKVTDKRMFTADGELREDFRHLEGTGESERKGSDVAPEPLRDTPPPSEPTAQTGVGSDPAASSSAHVEMPHTPGALGSPEFLDLIGVLAEPIAIYLGDATLPDGSSAENLDAARFYIDLLEVLRKKTAGNLTVQEASVLEDLLYQLRMRYVRKQG